MKTILAIWRREPAVLTGLVASLLACAASFGLHVTEEQKRAILAMVPMLMTLAVVIRQQVSPAAKAAPKADASIEIADADVHDEEDDAPTNPRIEQK